MDIAGKWERTARILFTILMVAVIAGCIWVMFGSAPAHAQQARWNSNCYPYGCRALYISAVWLQQQCARI